MSLAWAVVEWLERVLLNRMHFWMERDKVIINWLAGRLSAMAEGVSVEQL